MTPTDRLPLSSDRAATQAVDPLRLPAARRYPNNLPLELNRFIGRERQLREIKPLLWPTCLSPPPGPGDCGKTRLELRFACEHLLPACAHLAEGLLRACPNLCILVTNWEALNYAYFAWPSHSSLRWLSPDS